MTWVQTRDAVLIEAQGLVDAVAAAVDAGAWEALTTCEGWSAGRVATHVGAVMHAQQDAFVAMLDGRTDTPPWSDPPLADPATATATLVAAHSKAIDVMGQLSDAHADRPVPLPFGTFPSRAALEILLLEYGVHRWDIAHAIDPAATVSHAAAASVLRQVPAFLVFFAAGVPGEPLAYRLEAPGTTIDVSARDGEWVLEPSGAPTTTIVAERPSDLALLVLGRIGADHPGLHVDGDAAPDLKRWFPGP